MKNFFFCASQFSLLLISLSFCAHAQSVNATTQLDSSDYRIGDSITLHLSVDHPYGVAIDWMQHADVQSPFEIISESTLDSIKQKSFLTEKKNITIISFDTGRVLTPGLKVWYHLKDGTSGNITTNQIPIHLSIVKVNLANSFRSITPPLSLPQNFSMLIWLAIAIAVLTGVGFFFIRKWNKKKRIARSLKNAPIAPVAATVLEQLQKLNDDWKEEKMSVGQFYMRLTSILRVHIGTAFGIAAHEKTSSEIIRSMKKQFDNGELLRKISECLELADLVKFAKVLPSSNENFRSMESAFEFVKKTSNGV